MMELKHIYRFIKENILDNGLTYSSWLHIYSWNNIMCILYKIQYVLQYRTYFVICKICCIISLWKFCPSSRLPRALGLNTALCSVFPLSISSDCEPTFNYFTLCESLSPPYPLKRTPLRSVALIVYRIYLQLLVGSSKFICWMKGNKWMTGFIV